MIAVIVYVIFLICIIAAFIHDWDEVDDLSILVGIFIVVVSSFLIVGIPHVVSNGHSINPDNISYIDDLYITRTDIENNIDIDNITADNLKAINKYNDRVNTGNTYWHRFKLEDRSEYLIDYDYYFNLYKKQQEDKLKLGSVIDNEPEYTIYYPDEEYWNRAKSEV